MSRSVPGPENPLISVVMPVFDARPYLAEAVGSIQAQTYRNWELILVDDGSRDGSGDLARELAAGEPRIRVLATEHGGAAHAVNAGAALAGGELLARMDADDVALPERFEVQLAWMRRSGVQVAGSWVMRFGGATGVLWFPETHAAISHEMLFRHGLLQPTAIMPTAAFLAHRYREDARLEGNELWLRLRRELTLGNVPAVLVRHRCHPRQTRVVKGAEMRDHVAATRRSLFGELYPEAGAADLDAVHVVASGGAARDLAQLDLAGEWLARLADLPDGLLRRRMLARWRLTCRSSAAHGPAAYRLYRRWASEIDTAAPVGDRALRAMCAVRLDPASPPGRAATRIRAAARRARRPIG